MSVGSPHVRPGMVWLGRVVSLLLGVVAVEGGFGWLGCSCDRLQRWFRIMAAGGTLWLVLLGGYASIRLVMAGVLVMTVRFSDNDGSFLLLASRRVHQDGCCQWRLVQPDFL